MDPFTLARAWHRAWVASVRLWLPVSRGYPLPPYRPVSVRGGNVVSVDFKARQYPAKRSADVFHQPKVRSPRD